MTIASASTPSCRARAARLPEPVQADHRRLLTAHLDGLVARAEGKVLEPAGAARTAPGAARIESPVAARLRAFGTNGIDPRVVGR